MRLYPDYKMQYKPALISFLAILFIVPGVFGEAILFAQTAQEVRNKIEQKNADIAKLEQQIKAFQIELEGLGKQKNSLGTAIKQLDVTKKKFCIKILRLKKLKRT